MQAAEHGLTGHRPNVRSLNDPRFRRTLPKPQMRPRLMVVRQVFGQHPPQMPFAQHDHVVKALPPDRADDPFAVAVLPRRPARDDDRFDAHAIQRVDDLLPIDSIPIPDQGAGCRVKRERLDQLQTGPFGGGVSRHVEVNDAPSI